MRKASLIKLLLSVSAVLAVGACSNAGCTGPKGDMGPSGSTGQQGAPAAVASYYYNSSFDTQADLSEWTVYKSGGAGLLDAYLDSTVFNSPSKAMGVSVTGTVSGDSFVYKTLAFDLSKDIWVEFDWLLVGMTGENEMVLNIGGQTNKACIGYDASNIYLTQGVTRVYPAPAIATSQWHHVKMKLDPSTAFSSYWLDGLSLGTNYTTAILPAGVPPSGNFLGLKIGFPASSKVRIDNLVCYRY